MPAIGAITINDGQAAPAAHTFNPTKQDVQNDQVIYHENGSNSPVSWPKLVIKNVAPSSMNTKNGVIPIYEVDLSIMVPTMESLGTSDAGFTPQPSIAFFEAGNVRMRFPATGTKQGRKNIRMYLANLLQSTTVTSVVDDLNFLF